MEFKEIFYYLFILNLLQFSLTKSVENSSPFPEQENDLTSREQLLEFYKNGLKNFPREYCEKAKIISENILKDERIQRAETPQIQEFKKNITEFLDKYDSYARHGLYKDLVLVFTEKTIYYVQEDEEMMTNNLTDDAKYIEKLLKRLDYIKLDDDYQDKHTEFIVTNFKKRFEEFKSRLTEKELIKNQDFIEFYDELTDCEDYNCVFERISKSPNEPKDDLIEYIQNSIRDIQIYYCDKAIKISNKLVQDAEFLQTKTAVIQEFKKNITEFIKVYNSNDDPEKLAYISEIYSNATAYYFEIPKDKLNADTNLIVSVLRKLGSEQLETECEEKFMDLVLNKIAEKFLELKSLLDKKDFEKLKPLMEWHEELKSRKTSVLVALEKLNNL